MAGSLPRVESIDAGDRDLEEFIAAFLQEARGTLEQLLTQHREVAGKAKAEAARLRELREDSRADLLPGCLADAPAYDGSLPPRPPSVGAPQLPVSQNWASVMPTTPPAAASKSPSKIVPATASLTSFDPVSEDILRGNNLSTYCNGGSDRTSAMSEAPKGSRLQSIQSNSVSVRSTLLQADTVKKVILNKRSSEQQARQGQEMRKQKTMIQTLTQKKELDKPPVGMFVDSATVKEKIHNMLYEKEYDVKKFYHTEGICQAIARSILFENITMSVILLNILYLAVDAEWNDKAQLVDSHIGFILSENFFCTYYTGEIVIRFFAFVRKRDCLQDFWFSFDSLLVVCVVGETWLLTVIFTIWKDLGASFGANGTILRVFRLLRLTKVLRMVRVLKLMPELLVLSKGLLVAFRSVCWTFVLLMVIVYVFVITFKQLTDGLPIGEEYFSSVPNGILTLLIRATLPDFADLVIRFGQAHLLYGALMLLFIVLASLLVLNMLIGVLVEVVSFVSSVEKEQLQVSWVRVELQKILKDHEIGTDGSKFSRQDFCLLLTVPEAVRVIQQLGVDVLGLVDFSDFFFRGTEEICFGDFMELILQLRGSNKATVKDVVDLRRHMIVEFVELKNLIEDSSRGSDHAQHHHFQPPTVNDLGLKLTGAMHKPS